MPSHIQAALLVVLADETTVYPDDVKTLTARDLCPAIGLDTVHAGTIAANLVALRQRGLAWRQPGPGSGGWCITAEGVAVARNEEEGGVDV
ncbi:hypothetical protein GKE82_24140 [Conexibacter sp. W3-3-2]|uniref:hypothetical protein n=1 Tax=Conexibacter sp. W3-3-2 TaxID=2675227 RepID=UPI0012B72A18|nr:hypothetical protein [Conexibacter sp. W3-3-2]MTD47299.1 hypothetical protein [Conexibacter sp. W3-3-2]